MSREALSAFNRLAGLSSKETLVLTNLCKQHASDHRVSKSVQQIAEDSGLSASTVKRALTSLEQKGLLQRYSTTKSGRQTCNEYDLLFVENERTPKADLQPRPAGSFAGSDRGSKRPDEVGHNGSGVYINKYPPLPPKSRRRGATHSEPIAAGGHDTGLPVIIHRGTPEWDAWLSWAIIMGRKWLRDTLRWDPRDTLTVPSRFPSGGQK